MEARSGHEDAVIARMYDHMRHHQATRVSLEVWLTGDGNLRRTREHAKAYQQAQGYTLRAWTTDHWDFGIITRIAIPSLDQILKEPDGQGK